MRYLLDEQGITQFYELGPGRVLCGLAEAHRPQSAVREHRGVIEYNFEQEFTTEDTEIHRDELTIELHCILLCALCVLCGSIPNWRIEYGRRKEPADTS